MRGGLQSSSATFDAAIGRFVASRLPDCRSSRLRASGDLAPALPVAAPGRTRLIERRYVVYLREERGVAETTIAAYLRLIHPFIVEYLGDDSRRPCLPDFPREDAPFLDPTYEWLETRLGYERRFHAGPKATEDELLRAKAIPGSNQLR